MGASTSCETCPVAVTHSVISFSNELVQKMAEGIEPEPLSVEELRKREMADTEWFEKMKCIDNSHSIAFGITLENFYKLCSRIEMRLSEKTVTLADDKELGECYREFPKCTLRCTKFVESYVDSVENRTVNWSSKNLMKEEAKKARKK